MALNVTATRALQAGFLTAYPCGVAQPDASNVNYSPGIDRANMVTARVGVGGQVCIYASAEVDVIVDVLGAYGSTGSAPYEPVVPARVFDSRFAGEPSVPSPSSVRCRPATAVVLNPPQTARRRWLQGLSLRSSPLMSNINRGRARWPTRPRSSVRQTVQTSRAPDGGRCGSLVRLSHEAIAAANPSACRLAPGTVLHRPRRQRRIGHAGGAAAAPPAQAAAST